MSQAAKIIHGVQVGFSCRKWSDVLCQTVRAVEHTKSTMSMSPTPTSLSQMLTVHPRIDNRDDFKMMTLMIIEDVNGVNDDEFDVDRDAMSSITTPILLKQKLTTTITETMRNHTRHVYEIRLS